MTAPVAPPETAVGEPLVVLTDVNKHFGELHVLNDINLTVHKGDRFRDRDLPLRLRLRPAGRSGRANGFPRAGREPLTDRGAPTTARRR
jgi:hypothetical protein